MFSSYFLLFLYLKNPFIIFFLLFKYFLLQEKTFNNLSKRAETISKVCNPTFTKHSTSFHSNNDTTFSTSTPNIKGQSYDSLSDLAIEVSPLGKENSNLNVNKGNNITEKNIGTNGEEENTKSNIQGIGHFYKKENINIHDTAEIQNQKIRFLLFYLL